MDQNLVEAQLKNHSTLSFFVVWLRLAFPPLTIQHLSQEKEVKVRFVKDQSVVVWEKFDPHHRGWLTLQSFERNAKVYFSDVPDDILENAISCARELSDGYLYFSDFLQ